MKTDFTKIYYDGLYIPLDAWPIPTHILGFTVAKYYAIYEEYKRYYKRAAFNNDAWNLTFQEYVTLWPDDWTDLIVQNYTLILEKNGPWTTNNCKVVTLLDSYYVNTGRPDHDTSTFSKYKDWVEAERVYNLACMNTKE